MDKTIVTALLIIAGVISAIFVFNAIYPAIQQSGDAMTSMERRIDDRMKTQVQIVHAARSGDDAVIWIKNVGSTRIVGLEGSDLFFGPEGNFVRLPYGGTATPHWSYTVENDSEWKPSATIKITISGFTFLAPGTRYFVKIVTPIGISDELYFSE